MKFNSPIPLDMNTENAQTGRVLAPKTTNINENKMLC